MEIPQRSDLHRARQELATPRAGVAHCAANSLLRATAGRVPRSALRGVRPIHIDKIVTCITDDRVVVTVQVSHEIRLPGPSWAGTPNCYGGFHGATPQSYSGRSGRNRHSHSAGLESARFKSSGASDSKKRRSTCYG